MKTLTIRKLKNKLGNAELMIGTDVLKIPLSLVRCINKHPFPTLNEKKVVHEWCEERSDRWVMSGSEYPISKPSYLHYDHRFRLGHSGLVDEWMELASLNLLIMNILRPHNISFKDSFSHPVPIISVIQYYPNH